MPRVRGDAETHGETDRPAGRVPVRTGRRPTTVHVRFSSEPSPSPSPRRDPGAHQGPDTFDIDRQDKDHLAFGYGIHYCLGAPLARLEAEVALRALFARFPRLSLAADPEPAGSFIGNDVYRMPVRLNRRPA